MAPEDPDSPDPTNGDLEQIWDLAERITTELPSLSPDWCAIARNARSLAEHAQRRCPIDT